MMINLAAISIGFALLSTCEAVVVDDQGEGIPSGANRWLQGDGGLDPEPDAWIVEFQPGARGNGGVSETANAMAKGMGGKVGFVYEHAIEGFVFHGKNIEGLLRNPNVLSVTRDSISTVASQSMPNGVKRIFARRKEYMNTTSATCFCDAIVAVIDTGVDFNHPDLNSNQKMSVDCTSGACIVGAGKDDHGHGTHVAGTIGAINNNQGVVGVCPGAEIWAVKVLNSAGSGYRSWVIAGLDWVVSQAATIDVVNMSIGGSGCDSTYCNTITAGKNAGIAFAVAAGNSNTLASWSSPACCAGALTVSALADYDGRPGGIGVAGTCRAGADDSIADFSNYGSAVNIAAPGACVRSTTLNNSYAVLSGTSMASPHVAGALAILASNNHNGNVTAMYSTLLSSGNKNYIDSKGDGRKEPLLDLRTLPEAKTIGTCSDPQGTLVQCQSVLSVCRRSDQCCAGLRCRIRQGRTRGKCVNIV